MEKDTYHIDLTQGNLIKNLFVFSVPLMLTNCLQMVFNAADTIVVGKFSGSTALAAVGATGSVIFLLISLFNGITIGTNIVVSKYIGAKNDEKIRIASHTSIWLAFAVGIFLTCVGLFFSRPLLKLMSTPEDLLEYSTMYMKIYFTGIIFMLVYNFATAILRSSGDTKRPLYFLMIAGALNVVLNLLFVIVFHLGVVGVALATVISQAVSAILVMITLMNETNATKFNWRYCKLDLPIAKEILSIGIPAGIQGLVFSFSNVVIQSSINSFNSSNLIAGNSAAVNLENFVYIGMSAFMQACISFTSQNVGAKQIGKIKEIMWMTLLLCVGSVFLVAVILYCNGHFFLSFYTNSVDVEKWGMYRLLYVTLLLPIQGVSDVMIGSMRGMGYSILPTVCMLAGICGIRLVWLWFIFPLFPTLSVVYLCFPISWTCTGLLQIVLWIVSYRKFLKNNMSEKEVQYK